MDLADRVERTSAYFERVFRDVFDGDPASNAALSVDVLGAHEVDGRQLLALITPWTINGLFFPLEGDPMPEWLELAGRRRRVFDNRLDEIGHYGSLVLVGEVACVADMTTARLTVQGLLGDFERAVTEGLGLGGAKVDDPGRRAFLGLS